MNDTILNSRRQQILEILKENDSLSRFDLSRLLGFNKNVYDHLSNLYSRQEIDRWEKGSKMFKKGKTELDPSIYKRELERFVIELSWKSSQIEGNTYSIIETETLIKQNIRAQGHPE